MDNVDKIVGGIIRSKRKELGMTQTELADKVGSSTQSIYYYEKGTRGLSMGTFFKICATLHLDPNEIQRIVSRKEEND